MTAVSSKRTLRRRLLIGSVALLLAALAAETAVRMRLYFQTGTFGFLNALVEDEASGLMIPRPGRVTTKMRIDSRGFRSPEIEQPKPPGRVRIAFLGGSTTFCTEVTGNENTWPSLVAEGVRRAYPELDLDYVNAAVPGYATDSILLNLDRRVAPLEPDVIVICEATNDLTKDSRVLAFEQGLYTGHGDEEDWLSGYSLAWALLRKNLTYRARLAQASEARDTLAFDPVELARVFHDHLGALVVRAQELAPVVVLLTFTQRARAGQSSEQLLVASSSSLYYMPYMSPEKIRDAFAAYNRTIRGVAAEQGVLLVAGEDEIPADDAHFTDSVHFTAEGCRAMASRVLGRLIGAPEFERLR